MYDLNLPPSDLTPYLRRGRQERAETIARLLRGGTHAIWRTAIDALGTLKELAAAASAAYNRRRRRRETIRELRGLNDRILKDIGIPRSQIWAIAEAMVAPATLQEPRSRHRPVTPDPIRWQDPKRNGAVTRLPANRNQRSGRIAAAELLAGCG